ncbi:MAG: TIGR02757 family protein [Bacteroidetes bacterium]|nr:TIGR02757 family protein [Bacteroidota bacterium]
MAIFSESDLIELAHRYAGPDFIEADPISIPYKYTKKEDVEISGFCTALISWGNRASILRSAQTWMDLMWDSPYEFVMQAEESDLNSLSGFVHRTFNGSDAKWLVLQLRQTYQNGGLEACFSTAITKEADYAQGLHEFRAQFLKGQDPGRSGKHIADPLRGSAAKRINMFLRWMVRSRENGVDFGLWNSIPASQLHLPLDVHSGTVAREFGLLSRKQNDWQSVVELTDRAKQILPQDPAFLDYALFGMGVEAGGSRSKK